MELMFKLETYQSKEELEGGDEVRLRVGACVGVGFTTMIKKTT